MTGLVLSVEEELLSSFEPFEPCLNNYIPETLTTGLLEPLQI